MLKTSPKTMTATNNQVSPTITLSWLMTTTSQKEKEKETLSITIKATSTHKDGTDQVASSASMKLSV